MLYPVVDDELLRLDALRALKIVDTPRTAAFDAVAQLAADTLACPISFISLLDEDRQWFKAECGLSVSSTARDIALCNYTVLGTDVLVVEDTLRDERFKSNPLVTGHPRMRFYAGMPIVTEGGYCIGALCVGDTRPRRLAEAEVKRLRGLASLAEALVAAHAQSVRAVAAAEEAAEQAQLLWKRNRILRQVERIGKIGGWELDLKTNKVNCSDEISRIHDLPDGGPHDLEQGLSFYPGHWRAVVTDNIDKTLATGEPYDFEAEFISALGTRKWVRAAGECEFQSDEPVRLFGIFQDITQEKIASTRLWRAANFDDLTGLPNRRHFNQMLETAIAQARQACSGVALMILDLDNFKQVNDTRGHGTGDEILAEIGRRLAQESCEGCFAARLGGDEFGIILSEGQSGLNIDGTSRRLLSCLRHPVRVGPSHVFIGGTLGVARFPEDACTAEDLMKKADLGLYAAKQTGRGSVHLYRPELATLFERHTKAADLLRSALAHGRLVPFYQRKVHLDDGRCYGFEALARIVCPDGDIIGPSTFGCALEDWAIARRMGKHMLHAVTADIRSWLDSGLDPISVSLNVCEADFSDGKLAERVLHRLSELALPPEKLSIEVTETVFLGEGAKLVRETLERLDREGVRIELDDFGTGYASLSHLRAFPVSRLKIDRTFVDDLGVNDESRVIVQAVIDLAHNLGCGTVAEGVESELQAELLRDMRCEAAQGFHFGRPVSAEDTQRTLVAERARQERLLGEIGKRHGRSSRRLRA